MTELIWDGKYLDGKKVKPVRIALPFQTIETINESAQDRLRTLDLFSAGREAEWRNRLIWGDKKYVLPSLLSEFAGKVKLIYIDPPFDTGSDFSYTARIPEHLETDGDGTSFVKEPSILEQKAYRDTWGRGLDSYLEWFYETCLLLSELLAEEGSIYIHLDWHVGHYAKAVADEVFGAGNFRNEIVWQRANTHNDPHGFGRIHDNILFYSRSNDTFNVVYGEYDEAYVAQAYRHIDADGRRYRMLPLHSTHVFSAKDDNTRVFGSKVLRPPSGKYWRWSQKKIDHALEKGLIVVSDNDIPSYKKYLDEAKGVQPQSIWTDLTMISRAQMVGYPTQKPESLLERIIKASSNEGDLVLDCFVGSGTTACVAEKLNRPWLACDLGRFAIHTSRKRLLRISGVRPFVVQNLGKYERQAWQAAEFAAPDDLQERELRYRRFILDLYHATSVIGHGWLHGAKSGRMVHVGAVDAPVTLADVKAIAAEVWRAVGRGKDGPKTAGVDVLGWEFAFELNELARQVAAEARVDVGFKKIPREVLEKRAVEQGDIRFFELAALSVEVKVSKRALSLKLTDFLVSPDDIPEDVRRVIKHWDQYVDYWAVDWDYKGDTFHNQWQAYRTRENPKLETATTHSYAESGKHTVLVKVIDILGNDTTKALEVEVR